MAAPPHGYWQHQFLHAAGLPVTSFTVYFLTEWAHYEKPSPCAHNPIQLSQREPGSTRCQKLPSGKVSRNYTDTANAANAFADQLNLTDYPDLRKALASGSPFRYDRPDGVALNLQEWGSVRFQAWFVAEEGLGTGAPAAATAPRSKNVGGAWSHLMKVLARDGHRTIVELNRATASLNRLERRLRRA